jgi:Flp pilus assembly protein TadD
VCARKLRAEEVMAVSLLSLALSRLRAPGVQAGALLLVLGVLVYGRVGGFDYSRTDDFGYIILNGHVRSGLSLDGIRWAFTAFDMGNWHPLMWVSLMADTTLFGLAPGPRHVVNVVIHLCNSLLVWRLAIRLLREPGAALLVAALFLVHPLHVESVAWISERKDVLLDLWPALRPAFGGHRALQGYGAACKDKLPLFAAAVFVAWLTVLAQGHAIAPLGQVSVLERWSNVPVALTTYLVDLLLPSGLASFYPFRIPDPLREVLPSAALLAGTSYVCWRTRQRYPELLWGWVWFLVTIAPVSGVVQAGSQSHADRYMYLPSIGLLLCAGLMFRRLRDGRALYAAVLAALLVAFHTGLAWIQVGYWRDPAMIYGRVLDVSGEHYTVSVGLAAYALERGAVDEAYRHARRAVELGAEQAASHATLGYVALQTRNWALAEKGYRAAITLAPDDAAVTNNLGLALEQQGRSSEARAAFRRALELDPAMPGFRKNLDRVEGAQR